MRRRLRTCGSWRVGWGTSRRRNASRTRWSRRSWWLRPSTSDREPRCDAPGDDGDAAAGRRTAALRRRHDDAPPRRPRGHGAPARCGEPPVRSRAMSVTLDDLATPFVDEMLPWLDREQPPKMGTGVLAENWRRDGYVILPGFLSPQVIDAYADAWIGANADRLMGWPDNCPYMRIGALRRLCCDTDLAQILAFLIGEPMGVHLNLTGWRSTTRDWHQDGYLNPDHVADHYAAVWVALDDIHPDAGPFEYVPGSHRMIPPIRQKPMLRALGTDESNPDWPAESERILTPLFEELIAERELPVRQFIARK